MEREIKTEIKTYKVDILCEKCDCVMFPTGAHFLTYPMQYQHQCNKCGSLENFTDTYPKIVHE